MIVALRDEIARLKGGPGRPNIKPSGMEQATAPASDRAGNRKRPRGSTRSKLSIDAEQIIKVVARRPAHASKATRASWCRIW